MTVSGATTTHDFTLPSRTDSFGYTCRVETPSYVEANTPFPLSGDDSFAPVTLPFAFSLYGQTYTSANVCTNGFITFGTRDLPVLEQQHPEYGDSKRCDLPVLGRHVHRPVDDVHADASRARTDS